MISDDKRLIQNREMCRNDERNKRRVFIDKGRRLKERRGKLIVASPDPYCFQRIFLRIQYKTISGLLTADILHTVWTKSLQVALLQVGARRSERWSLEIVPLFFHAALIVVFVLVAPLEMRQF